MPHHRLFNASLGLLFGLLFFMLGAQPAFAASPIFVTPDGTGDGSSWVNDATLQHAVNIAAAGDEIWVATGIYTPGLTATDSFTLVAGVSIYGGFAATETLRSQRDWLANPTVLSGDIGGDDQTDANGVVTDTANISGTNSIHVLIANGITPITDTTKLDGFTISAGDAIGGNFIDNFGGGLVCIGEGGALCSPHLENLTFTGNRADDSGGAMFSDGELGGSSPSLLNVIFAGNRAASKGGALYNSGDGGVSSPSIVNVIFRGNHAGQGGALFNEANRGESSPTLVNVAFSNNVAEVKGGGAYNAGAGSNPSYVNVTFSGNSAANGGAVYNNGGRSVANKVSFVNVILWGNSAISGTQMSNHIADVTFTNSLVQGGITGTGVVTSTSIITDGGGNLDADPLFTDAAHDDLRLDFGSAAIDTGDNSAITYTTDLQGNPRKIDGDGNGTIVVDMGALEAPVAYPVSVFKAGNGSGEVAHSPDGSVCAAPCTAFYREGSAITLTATANTGSSFSGWSGDCTGPGNPPGVCQLTVDAAKQVTATFALNSYPLTVHPAGNGSGTVLPNQPNYLFGTVVTLTATADTGLTFTDWSGDCTGPNPCVVTIDESNDITATFTKNSYPLTVHTAGNGSVQPNQGNYLFGASVTLTATADSGSTFTGWSGDCTGPGNPPGVCQLTIDTANAVTATFALNSYPLTVHTAGNGSGTVLPNQPNYLFGTVVTLTATADTGSTFTGWSGDCAGPNPCVVTIDQSNDITATFTKNSYPLTVHTAGNGSVQPNQGNYLFGASVILTATAGNGSSFSGWSGDCAGPGNPPGVCHLTIDTSNAVTATFALNSYPLTVHHAGTGSGTVQPNGGSYSFGASVTLTATADSGSTFTGWSGDCTGLGNPPGVCQVTIDTANAVTATFTEESGPDNHAPGFVSSPGISATVGTPYTYSVVALDPESGDVLALSAPTKPAWLTLTETSNGSATLSGTPGAANVGANAVQLRVEDEAGAFATQSFTIAVATASEPVTQTGSVQGKVQDTEGNGIAGAEVTLTSDGEEVVVATVLTQTTDGNGDYLFEGVPAGAYTLTASAAGRESSAPVAVTVQAGKSATAPTITLLPSKALLHLPIIGRDK